MMFVMHISGLFALSVLLASTALIIWSLRNKGKGSSLGKVVGSLIFIGTILALVCIGYYGLKYWAQGDFETLNAPTTQVQMRKEMMQQMMPMMMQQMMKHMSHKGNKGQMGTTQPNNKMKNMYNMEHLQNMGSQEAIGHMKNESKNESGVFQH